MIRKIILSLLLFPIYLTHSMTGSDVVHDLANQGIIQRQSNIESYRLNDSILRQELIATIVNGLYGEVNQGCSGYYLDVTSNSPNNWACSVIEFAADMGIVTRSNATFRPEDRLTKAEALGILLGSICHNPRVDRSIWDRYSASFEENYPDWQKKTLINAHIRGIIPATWGSRPNSFISRGETFVYLSKILELETNCVDPSSLGNTSQETGAENQGQSYQEKIRTIHIQSAPSQSELSLLTVLDESGKRDEGFTGFVVMAYEDGLLSYSDIVVFLPEDRGQRYYFFFEEDIQRGLSYSIVEKKSVGSYRDTSFRQGSIDLMSAPEEDQEDEQIIIEEGLLRMSLPSDIQIGVPVDLKIEKNDPDGLLDDTTYFTIVDGDPDAQIGEDNELFEGFMIEQESFTAPITFTKTGKMTLYLYNIDTNTEWRIQFEVGVGEGSGQQSINQADINFRTVSCGGTAFSGKECALCYESDHPAIIWKNNTSIQELVYRDELSPFIFSSDTIMSRHSDWQYGDDIIWTEYEGVQEFYIAPGDRVIFSYYTGSLVFSPGKVLQYPLYYREFNVNTFEESEKLQKNICVQIVE